MADATEQEIDMPAHNPSGIFRGMCERSGITLEDILHAKKAPRNSNSLVARIGPRFGIKEQCYVVVLIGIGPIFRPFISWRKGLANWVASSKLTRKHLESWSNWQRGHAWQGGPGSVIFSKKMFLAFVPINSLWSNTHHDGSQTWKKKKKSPIR